jgi:hypothetical protein
VVFATIIGTTILFNRPAPSLAGAAPVPTTTSFHTMPAKEKADGTLTVETDAGRADAYVANGRVYQTAEQRDKSTLAGFKLTYNRDRNLWEPTVDAGCFAGYWNLDATDTHKFQPGVRFSPMRVLYGTLAPDALVTSQGIGYGVSFYLPSEYFGYQFWDHIGLQVGRLHAFDGSGSAGMFGLAFSVHH